MPRGEFVKQQFGAPESALLKALSDRFLVRVFRFSSTAGRLESAKDLTFGGSQTRLGPALDGAREELAGLPVSGVVLVSDGADTSDASFANSLLGMKAEKLPVYTVGVGSAQLPRDIQIDRVSTPRSVLKGASLLVDVVVTQTGYGGRTVTVDVEDEGRIVGSEQVRLPADDSPATVRVRATASEAGPRLFKFRVAPQSGRESWRRTTFARRSSRCETSQDKILYFEGEPRFEMKFIRRAVADDKNLQLVVLQRTADNKFLRLGVDGPDELVGGFPKTREELFSYRGLILGSIEAGAFSGDQLQMIADFVDRRGGNLLMLGGARAFAEGGYGGTPVADALPLVIDPRCAGVGAGRLGAAAGTADARGSVARRDPDRQQRSGVGRALARSAAGDERQCDAQPETRRDRASDRHRRPRPVAAGTDVASVRARQGAGAHAAGHLAVADARQHLARGSDARKLLAADAALARRRRTRGRRGADDRRSCRAG